MQQNKFEEILTKATRKKKAFLVVHSVNKDSIPEKHAYAVFKYNNKWYRWDTVEDTLTPIGNKELSPDQWLNEMYVIYVL